MPNKYERGKIYKIVCNETGKIYVGSTTEPTLARRLAGHRGKYKEYLNGGNSISSIEIIKNENYYIELICNAPCNSKDELRVIEGKYIRELDCINKRVAGRTQKQYYIDNKERLKTQHQEYYENNKNKIKDYRITNSDKIKERKKKYREDNTDKIKQIMKQKFTCDCGGKYIYSTKARHFKSKKHQKYLNLQN